MYKLLLCWRYLLTRYLALACIISVMLGVATLIVVNSVMSGFSTKLRDRLHGILADVLIEAQTFNGFANPHAKMERIRNSPIGDKIEAMTPVMEVFAMLQFRIPRRDFMDPEEMMTRPVKLFGIEPEGWKQVGGFASYLKYQGDDQSKPVGDFTLRPDALHKQKMRSQMMPHLINVPHQPRNPNEPPPPDPPPSREKIPEGIIVGNSIASFRMRNPHPKNPNGPPEYIDQYMLHEGDDVIITTVSGEKLAPVFDRFALSCYFKSEMSEYDASYVFVPLEYLQKLRAMENRVTSIHIKLKDEKDSKEVKEALAAMFPDLTVETWMDKQGPLLSAIDIERGLLNVLLFLIICVAGFGILAIFAMIVVEKTRDIGILKALGASNGGVMKIFLGYGLLLGVVGAGIGTALGLTITWNLNAIEHVISTITHRDIFDKSVYYFNEIPTDVRAWNVVWVNIGAIGIAVLFSVLPALRAALLHPVRALRYE